MNQTFYYLLIIAAGYLIGSISFARIIFARLRPGEEPVRIRTPTTDGKAELVAHAIGATNVMLAFGPRWGMLATMLDVAKAFVPTLVLSLIFPDQSYHLFCAVSVLTGHLWPVWYRFSGGGGNSCILGMLLAISPIGLLLTHGGGMIIGKVYPVLSFLAGVALTIPWFAWRNGLFSPEAAFAVAITVLYVIGQLPEAKRMRQLKREGHHLEMRHVMNQMKHSAATGQPGEQFSKQDPGDS